jgi:hypothetical protein
MMRGVDDLMIAASVCSVEGVFSEVGPLIQSVLDGYNVCTPDSTPNMRRARRLISSLLMLDRFAFLHTDKPVQAKHIQWKVQRLHAV